MNKIFLALGANVGDKTQNILDAISLLSEKITNIKKASLYESKAAGYIDQDNFINTAISGDTNLNPMELLKFIKSVEEKIGRIKRFRWGPREIDVDILFYNNEFYKKNNLEIPHPRLAERDFVLIPLEELDPKLIHPIFKKTVSELLKELLQNQKSIIRKTQE